MPSVCIHSSIEMKKQNEIVKIWSLSSVSS